MLSVLSGGQGSLTHLAPVYFAGIPISRQVTEVLAALPYLFDENHL